MKKIFMIFTICIMTLLSGCVFINDEKVSDTKSVVKKASYEIALVMSMGEINDKAFNQSSWESVQQFAMENDISHKYYEPIDTSSESITEAMRLAIKGGATTLICPGYLFETPIYHLQDEYPDVNFILIDGSPKSDDKEPVEKVAKNTLGVQFAEEQAGFLAGYATVMDGYRNLGFMGGGAIPPVRRFSYGFMLGADYAGKELSLAKGDIKIKHTYVGSFEASPEHTTKASSWYNSGTEIIFACGGGIGGSIMKAGETAGAKVVGVDIDQSYESDTVITSAMKNVKKAVYEILTSIYDGSFEGGKSVVLDVNTGSVLLPMNTSKFKQFSEEQYDAIYDEIASGRVKIDKEKAYENIENMEFNIIEIESQ